MALRGPRGSLCAKFNLVGARLATIVSTETETEDAGSFGRHQPATSKFASMTPAASVPVPVIDSPSMRKKPAETLSRVLKV